MFIKYIFHEIQKCSGEFAESNNQYLKLTQLCCKDISIRKLQIVPSVQFLFKSYFLGSPLNSKLYDTRLKKSYYQQAFIVESEIGAGYFGTVYRFAQTFFFILCFSHCYFALKIFFALQLIFCASHSLHENFAPHIILCSSHNTLLLT